MPVIAAKEKVRLMRDGTVHALGLVLSSVAGLVLVPLLVRGLGREGYGLWIASVAAIGIFSAFDLGLRLIIVRDLAGELRSGRAPVLRLMLWLHVGLGVVCGLVVAAGGRLGSAAFHLSPEALQVAPLIFLVGGGSCFFDQIFAYVLSVWAGLRRFQLLNGYSVGASVLRLALFGAALSMGRGIVTIAVLHFAVSAASAITGLVSVFVSTPELRPRWDRITWRLIREPLGFGALSQVATSIASLQMPISTLLISTINGAAAVTPFTVGQKFPTLLSGLSWRTSEVFFPVASRQSTGEGLDPTQFLATISRWLTVIITPAAIGLVILAPMLLRTWMGSVDETALVILRIAAISVIVETLIPGMVQLAWGAGQTRVVLFVNLATMASDVVLALLLLPRYGPIGAALATLGSTAVAVILFSSIGCRDRGLRLNPVVRGTSRRLLPALIVGLVPAFIAARFVSEPSWTWIFATVALSALLYVAVFWVYTATEDEKTFMVGLFRRPEVTSSNVAAN